MTVPASARDLGPYLFSLAVIADTHMNEEESGSSSPYECNRLANARTRWVIERLNQLRPEVTIHLGDLIHPVPALPTYGQAARNFKQLTRALRSPLYLVPGNHDVGDKPVVWAPAATVTEAALALWTEHFGAHYHAFDVRGLHVVVIDAQIINSGLPAEAAQREWLERELAEHAGQRLFLCTHYPPYVSDRDEPESYDNLAEPGRSWLLGLIERYRPEAVFCGHVHNFWYNQHGETDCYILPSTAFVRQDYAELARVEPGDEAGRNDTPKLGFFLVKIHARGHVCHAIRTYGATLEPGETLGAPPDRVEPLHAWENPRAPLGVDLRHPWAEVVEVPPTGALDEFERKRARNDYPLLALWEMGIRKLRVPLQDLEDARVRERMRVLRGLGHEFTVYTLDVPPSGRAREALIAHQDLVHAWEVVCSWPEAARTLEAVAHVKQKAALPVYLSKLRTKEDVKREGSRYYHFINHGFLPAERDALEALWRQSAAREVVDGVVFRVARPAAPWAAIREAGAAAATLGVRASVHVRMASTNPAERFTDDRANASRIAEALFAAMAETAPGGAGLQVFVDTFADIDRGYFVRNGLVDRRWNPRLASHVVRHLYGALNAGAGPLTPGTEHSLPAGRLLTLEAPAESLALLLPEGPIRVDRVPDPGGRAMSGTARWVDLETGLVRGLPWRRAGDGLALDGHPACAVPTLIRIPSAG